MEIHSWHPGRAARRGSCTSGSSFQTSLNHRWSDPHATTPSPRQHSSAPNHQRLLPKAHRHSTDPSDNSYLDLTPGSSLRILVPILSGGQNHLAFDSTQSNCNSLTITVANLAGYEVSHYLAEGNRNGRVHLKFTSAEITKDGHTVPEAAAPHLPFQFPNKAQFIRLVFLVRISESDHNMAIVTADTQDVLETFTSQIRQNPNACQVTNTVSCVWVPEGIAVRPQTLTDTPH